MLTYFYFQVFTTKMCCLDLGIRLRYLSSEVFANSNQSNYIRMRVKEIILQYFQYDDLARSIMLESIQHLYHDIYKEEKICN